MRSISVLAALVVLAGCHPGADDVAPTADHAVTAEQAPMQAKRITIDADGLDQETIREIAEHIEGIGEIASVQVRVHKDDTGHTAIAVEVAGRDLPTDAYLLEEIRSFAGMENATVVVDAVHADDVAPDPMYADKDKTPEQIKAEVTERLRQQGIEGKVYVDVHDEDGERRVEVRVEANEDGRPPTDPTSDLAPTLAN